MDRLTEIETFARVVECGSFSLVARERRQTPSAISKQVAALEQRLGVVLLQRSTRSLSPTDAGRRYYLKCQVILEALADAEGAVREQQRGVVGHLRVTATVGFGRIMIAPRLRRLLDAHPRLTIDLHLSDNLVNLIEDGIDVAIRTGEPRDSNMVARPIGVARQMLVAAPAYLQRHPAPQQPADLARHNCLVHLLVNPPNEWRLEGAAGGVAVTVGGNLRASTSEALREAVLAGLGIGLGPSWMYGEDLAQGRVQRLLPDYQPPPLPLFALAPQAPSRSPKVAAFIGYLAAEFAANEWVAN